MLFVVPNDAAEADDDIDFGLAVVFLLACTSNEDTEEEIADDGFGFAFGIVGGFAALHIDLSVAFS